MKGVPKLKHIFYCEKYGVNLRKKIIEPQSHMYQRNVVRRQIVLKEKFIKRECQWMKKIRMIVKFTSSYVIRKTSEMFMP